MLHFHARLSRVSMNDWNMDVLYQSPPAPPCPFFAQAIDALALCDVDGRMFLEMDEEDLAESDELGLDVSLIGISFLSALICFLVCVEAVWQVPAATEPLLRTRLPPLQLCMKKRSSLISLPLLLWTDFLPPGMDVA